MDCTESVESSEDVVRCVDRKESLFVSFEGDRSYVGPTEDALTQVRDSRRDEIRDSKV